MPEGAIDVCVTSPPYNIGVRYGSYADDLDRGGYLSWMAQVSHELRRVIGDQGSLFLNLGFSSTDPWVDMDVANVFRADWVLQNRICWVKSVYLDGHTRGHFKPVNSARYLTRTWEQVLHFTKRGDVPINRLAIGVPYEDKTNIARFDRAADLRCRGNVWYLPYSTITDRAKQRGRHPATFPVELPRWCIELHGVERVRTVLDPFGGIGTTLAAALELGVKGIAIDIDHGYAGVTVERLLDLCETLHGAA
jgi:site-specific DNA-methyltransferase (adenine-specific)